MVQNNSTAQKKREAQSSSLNEDKRDRAVHEYYGLIDNRSHLQEATLMGQWTSSRMSRKADAIGTPRSCAPVLSATGTVGGYFGPHSEA